MLCFLDWMVLKSRLLGKTDFLLQYVPSTHPKRMHKYSSTSRNVSHPSTLRKTENLLFYF